MCEQHRDMLAETLAQIGSHYAQLRDCLEPGSVPDDGGEKRSGRRTDPPAPVRLDVLNLLDERARYDDGQRMSVLGVLIEWAERVREDRGLKRPTKTATFPPSSGPMDALRTVEYQVPMTVQSERELLVRHLDWICAQPWVADLWEALRRLDRALREAVGNPYPKPIGHCPVQDEDNTLCATPLYPNPGGDGVRCRGCGTAWSGTDLLRLRLILEAEAA